MLIVLCVLISFPVILFSCFALELIVCKLFNRLFNIILTVFEKKLNKNEKFLGVLSGELPREENFKAKMRAGRILEFSTRVSILWKAHAGEKEDLVRSFQLSLKWGFWLYSCAAVLRTKTFSPKAALKTESQTKNNESVHFRENSHCGLTHEDSFSSLRAVQASNSKVFQPISTRDQAQKLMVEVLCFSPHNKPHKWILNFKKYIKYLQR